MPTRTCRNSFDAQRRSSDRTRCGRAAAAELHSQLAASDVELVVTAISRSGSTSCFLATPAYDGPDSFMNCVDAASSTRSPPSRTSASSAGRNRTFLNRSPCGARQLVDDHATEVVPGVRVPIAGVAETGDEPGHGGGLALATLLGRRQAGLPPSAPGRLALGASPSAPSPASASRADLDALLAGHRQVGFDPERGRRDDREHGVLGVGEDRDARRASRRRSRAPCRRARRR